MQTERRTNPYPWTWEPAAAIAVGVALAAVIGVQVGRAAANWTAGAGWLWPRNPMVGLTGILGGDAAAGLDIAGPGADPGVLYAWIGGTELIFLTVLAAAGLWAARRWGPGRLKGMATAAEAEQTLGVSRLRRVRKVVRPDLYGSTGHATATTWRPPEPTEPPSEHQS
ncbi:MAG: conjugal transfer protein [Actinobacteria bacterium]|nr:conjugal transfer protein [Actinomycetota bacterium]